MEILEKAKAKYKIDKRFEFCKHKIPLWKEIFFTIELEKMLSMDFELDFEETEHVIEL